METSLSSASTRELGRCVLVGDDGHRYSLLQMANFLEAGAGEIDGPSASKQARIFYQLENGTAVDELGKGAFIVRSTRMVLRHQG